MSRPAPAHSGSGRVIERTLGHLAGAVEGALFAERIAHRPGLLQAIDPRARLMTTLAMLVAISLSHSLPVILALYLFTLLLAWRSAVPLGFFVKRIWLLLPFFTGIIALPALFLVPGPALLRLPLGLAITQPGIMTASFLMLRVGASVSAAVLLMLTTPWNSLLKALGVLHVPEVFVVILGMTYRYIYLLIRTSSDMFLSRQSRIVGRLSPAGERRLMAASAGVLLDRSLQLSGEVYLAMQSRGLRGYPRTIDTFHMHLGDWLYCTAIFVVLMLALWLGR